MPLPVRPHVPFASTRFLHEHVHVKSYLNVLLVCGAPENAQDDVNRGGCVGTVMKTVAKTVKAV